MPDVVPDDLPRSPSGRVPKWVVDQARGLPVEPVPFRSAHTPGPPPKTPKGSSRLRGVLTAVVVLAVVVSIYWMAGPGGVVGLLGRSDGTAAAPRIGPPPGHEERGHRLLPLPMAPAADSSSYRFLSHEDDDVTPVTWSPCRPIHYVVRPDNAPPGGAQLVQESFAQLQAATGLKFVYDGTTTEGPSADRKAYQPKRYGDRWAPVLVAWATPDEVPDFGVDIAGEETPALADARNGPTAYVSGTVYLDATKLGVAVRRGRTDLVRSVILHELGHLAGLEHVNDASQVMAPESAGVTAYQDGDLAGLARLGAGPCQPDI